jgi:SagB-type dehydrogenase family enzyme
MTSLSHQYHRQTSYHRQSMGGHYLDWNNQPSLYKVYPKKTPLPLSGNPTLPDQPLSGILRNQEIPPSPEALQEPDLSSLFRLTYSLTAKTVTGQGSFFYRSVASAGALYPTEIYLAASNLPGIDEGLYHYSIAHQGLTLLRPGNFSSLLDQAAQWPEGFHPGLTFFFTAIFFRSAWKYRDRAFRYHLLDTGHLIENLLLALSAQKRAWSLTYDFDDPVINHFLGLDPTREAVLALISLPDPKGILEPKTESLPDLDDSILMASRVAEQEKPYPLIQSMVRAGWKKEGGETSPSLPFSTITLPVNHWTSLDSIDPWPESLNYPAAVLTRRSKRNFIRQPLSASTFQALMEGTSLQLPGSQDIPKNSDSSLTVGLLIGQVEGFTPGFYLLDRKARQLGLIQTGPYLETMAHICLDQRWLGQAGFHMLFLSSPAALDRYQGPRGYRYALMSAGRLGERLYLLSSALGLGCCGIGAFYDQEAADLLGLDETTRLVYFVAVGMVKK